MVRRFALLFWLVSSFFVSVPTVHAVSPIQLPTEEVAKLKFVNFENWLDVGKIDGSVPGDGIINAGDAFEGILKSEAITNIPGNIELSAQLATKELTGYFKIHVAGGRLVPGMAGHLDFKLLPGDFIKLYVGTGATMNWDPAAPDAIARATDGTLWVSITDTDFFEGINDTSTLPLPQSINRNWANIGTNNTGYTIVKQLYSSTAFEPSAHFVDVNNDGVYKPGVDALHGDHLVDVYFASRLFNNTLQDIPNWQFRSEDPIYLWATNSCIDIKKQISVNGVDWLDADTVGDAPIVTAPHGAEYRLIVTNCGTVNLTNVTVSDNTLGINNFIVGNLAAGASMIVDSVTIPLLNQPSRCDKDGSFLNIATAFGFDAAGSQVGPVSDPAWLVCTAPKPASIGDFVWDDKDADGVQDAGEAGIPNVTVHLMDCKGNIIATTSTNASGIYLFSGLTPGDYNVHFVLPAGYSFSPQDLGGDDAKDSDANPANGMAACTTLSPGENDLTWDAGMYQKASLGDFVWHDLNANGIQDAGEPGLPGVGTQLIGCDGQIVPMVIKPTDANGKYLYNVAPGNWAIQFVPPAGYVVSPKDQGADDTIDSDADPATFRTACTMIEPGENDLTWDMGLYKPASIGDFVWEDKNANGVQEAGEAGIPNVTVHLMDCQNNIKATTTTNASGLYLFTGLKPGDYNVHFVLPTGYSFSPMDQGGDDTKDSDANPANGMAICTTLVSGENDLTWDAGMYVPLECNLKVNKTCAVEQPSTPSFDCSATKPFDKVLLKLGGTKNITSYKVYVGSKVDSAKLCDSGGSIGAGSMFTLKCTNSSLQSSFTSSNDIMMTFTFTDGTTGKSTFHKSCSDVDMNGAEDCGKLQGNGKTTDTTYYNNWIFDGMSGAKGQLLCSAPAPTPFPTGESCTAKAGDTIVYGYKVTNLGSPVTMTSVVDDKLGTIFSGSMPLATSQSTQFTKSTTINATTTNKVTVTSNLANGQICTATDSLTVDIPQKKCPGTGTPGYWKNHPEAWPVSSITICGKTYTKSQAIAWMGASDGDKTVTMFRSLVAAMLNVMIGNDDSCIKDTIAAAQAWMCSYGPVGKGVSASSKAWKAGEPLYLMLDKYNNGLMCCPSRDYTGDSHNDCPPR